MKFTLSVIIPVYNAERFIEKAIRSALHQPEVTEVIVINDGSTDGTQAILILLQNENPVVKVFQHPNYENKGRSATRNLGLQKATANYIAFLDADDYYLPNRFVNDYKVFAADDSIEGVYNAIGAHFYRNGTESEEKTLALYSVTQKTDPNELFNTLFLGKNGHFSVDGLTVKKSTFKKTGLFNEKLKVAEDTDILWKMSLSCKLVTGVIDQPVAIRGVHDENVFNNTELYKNQMLAVYQSVFSWGSQNEIHKSHLELLLKYIWILKGKENNSIWSDLNYWKSLFWPNPTILLSILAVKFFPIIRFRQKLFPFLFK